MTRISGVGRQMTHCNACPSDWVKDAQNAVRRRAKANGVPVPVSLPEGHTMGPQGSPLSAALAGSIVWVVIGITLFFDKTSQPLLNLLLNLRKFGHDLWLRYLTPFRGLP